MPNDTVRRLRIPTRNAAAVTVVLAALVCGTAFAIYRSFRIDVPARHIAVLVKKTGRDIPNGAYDLKIIEVRQSEVRGQLKQAGWVEIPTGYVGVVTNLSDKLDVLAVHHERLLERMMDAGERRRARGCRQRFRRLYGRIAAIALEEGRLFRELVLRIPTVPELRERERASTPRVFELFRRWLEEGIEAGEIRPDLDLRLAADLVGDAWYGTLRSFASAPPGYPLARILRRKLDLLFDGFEAR